MATSTSVVKAVDDLLICTICLETLKVPKYPIVTETCKSSIILENFIEQSLHKLSPENEQIIVRDFNMCIEKTSHLLLIQGIPIF
jgi:Fe-S-cluster-containing dehydrogenase component